MLKKLLALTVAVLAFLLGSPVSLATDSPSPPTHYGTSCGGACKIAYFDYGYMRGPGLTNLAYHVHSTDGWFMRIDGDYQHGGEDGYGAEVWFSSDCNLRLDDYRINSWDGSRYDWQREWNTTLRGLTNCNLRWQGDNNAVIYDEYHRPRWASGTRDFSGAIRFLLQDNGYLIFRQYPWYGGTRDLWCVPQPC